MTLISIIIPTRLAQNPNGDTVTGPDPDLWLDRAMLSVRGQRDLKAEIEVIIATSGGSPDVPDRFFVPAVRTREIWIDRPGQAAAVNAAVDAARGDYLAMLEDDDTFEPTKLASQLEAISHGYDLVTSNQRECDWEGAWIRMNDFPTPSGWFMKRETWDRVGPMNENFRFHVDTEWLGRANALKLRRLHIVETHAALEAAQGKRPWLVNVSQFSEVGTVGNDRPLVNRTANPEGGMALIAKGGEAAEQSRKEHEIMWEKFGGSPW